MAKNEDKDWLTVPMSHIGAEMIRIAMNRKHSAEQALNAFLDYAVSAFDIQKVRDNDTYDKWTKAILQEDEEYNHIVLRWMRDVNKSINNGEFCDFFGQTYESTFQGKGKASSTGQFFTPPSLCILMSEVTNQVDDDEKIVKVSDCCCGSGRLLLGFLASQIRIKKNLQRHRYVFEAEDIDPTSCKMAALNLMAHCCFGAVVCHDVLLNDPPHLVYLINECQVPYPNATMCIRTLKDQEAADWWLNGGVQKLPLYYGDEWQGRYSDEPHTETAEPPVEKPVEPVEAVQEAEHVESPTKKHGWVQLTLFD